MCKFVKKHKPRTYDADIKLQSTDDDDGDSIPRQIMIRLIKDSEGDYCSRRASKCHKDATGEQARDSDFLATRQLEAAHIRDREDDNDEIGERVDAPGREQVFGLVEAVLWLDG